MDGDGSSTPDEFRHNLLFLSQEIARLEQVVAALLFVLWDGDLSTEREETQTVLANWAMQVFHPESFQESLAEHFEPLTAPKVRPTGSDSSAEQQKQLFSASDQSPSAQEDPNGCG